MRRNSLLTLVLFFFFSLLLSSCGAPGTFIQTNEPGWNTIELRDDVSYDQAWNSIVDLLSRRFDIEVISKDDGYIRTGWLYSWTGKLQDNYRVRGIIKFTPEKKKVEVKSEAHYYSRGFLGIGSEWVLGMDELLTTTLRTDIMGKVGRVAR